MKALSFYIYEFKEFFMTKNNWKPLFAVFFLFSTVSLFSQTQNWTKEAREDRWGDITGYVWRQTRSGIAHGNKNVSLLVVFSWYLYQDYLIIGSKTLGDFESHPGSDFLDESITLSLRSNGITSTYGGVTSSSHGNFDTVMMIVPDPELINKLRSPGQWDVLIEGRNWYIRTTIIGNLPRQ
jgi:hypothetical protein